jgi:hypothetical protein
MCAIAPWGRGNPTGPWGGCHECQSRRRGCGRTWLATRAALWNRRLGNACRIKRTPILPPGLGSDAQPRLPTGIWRAPCQSG